jgi:hypothetical protein
MKIAHHFVVYVYMSVYETCMCMYVCGMYLCEYMDEFKLDFGFIVEII